ncbi:MAG: hypothetical protein ACTSRS_13605 [Candidatus Helarchaeota archaeon]
MTLEIYLISPNGLNIYSHIIGSDSSKDEKDSHLISCIVCGIIRALKSVIDKDANVQFIDLGRKKVYFKYGAKIWGFLISDEPNIEWNKKLEQLISKCELLYRDLLIQWNGNTSQFKNLKEIIEQIFNRNN